MEDIETQTRKQKEVAYASNGEKTLYTADGGETWNVIEYEAWQKKELLKFTVIVFISTLGGAVFITLVLKFTQIVGVAIWM